MGDPAIHRRIAARAPERFEPTKFVFTEDPLQVDDNQPAAFNEGICGRCVYARSFATSFRNDAYYDQDDKAYRLNS